MPSSSNSKKGQFFILSTFAIVGAMYLISSLIRSSSVVDTSQIVLLEYPFIFNNIRETAIEVVNMSKDCEELRFNLDEYKYFVEEFAWKKGYKISLDYFIPSCDTSANVILNLTLKAPNAYFSSNFTVKWVSP